MKLLKKILGSLNAVAKAVAFAMKEKSIIVSDVLLWDFKKENESPVFTRTETLGVDAGERTVVYLLCNSPAGEQHKFFSVIIILLKGWDANSVPKEKLLELLKDIDLPINNVNDVVLEIRAAEKPIVLDSLIEKYTEYFSTDRQNLFNGLLDDRTIKYINEALNITTKKSIINRLKNLGRYRDIQSSLFYARMRFNNLDGIMEEDKVNMNKLYDDLQKFIEPLPIPIDASEYVLTHPFLKGIYYSADLINPLSGLVKKHLLVKHAVLQALSGTDITPFINVPDEDGKNIAIKLTYPDGSSVDEHTQFKVSTYKEALEAIEQLEELERFCSTYKAITRRST